MIHRMRARPPRQRAVSRWLAGAMVALATLLTLSSFGATPPPSAAPQTLDAFANKVMQTFDPPGMSLVIVDGDKIQSHAYGVRKLGLRRDDGLGGGMMGWVEG